jgi:hypothetical protein
MNGSRPDRWVSLGALYTDRSFCTSYAIKPTDVASVSAPLEGSEADDAFTLILWRGDELAQL